MFACASEGGQVMNAESTFKDNRKAVGMFRLIFQLTVSNIDDHGQNILRIDTETFLAEAKKARVVHEDSIALMKITQEELGYFGEIMLDYLRSLRMWIKQSTRPRNISTETTTFFAQMFR